MLQKLLRMLEKSFALLGKSEALFQPSKKGYTKFSLKLFYGIRNGRLRNVKFFGCTGNIVILARRTEILQL